jgi:hypothetical protein
MAAAIPLPSVLSASWGVTGFRGGAGRMVGQPPRDVGLLRTPTRHAADQRGQAWP